MVPFDYGGYAPRPKKAWFLAPVPSRGRAWALGAEVRAWKVVKNPYETGTSAAI
jgi:hypothetical protein